MYLFCTVLVNTIIIYKDNEDDEYIGYAVHTQIWTHGLHSVTKILNIDFNTHYVFYIIRKIFIDFLCTYIFKFMVIYVYEAKSQIFAILDKKISQ